METFPLLNLEVVTHTHSHGHFHYRWQSSLPSLMRVASYNGLNKKNLNLISSLKMNPKPYKNPNFCKIFAGLARIEP